MSLVELPEKLSYVANSCTANTATENWWFTLDGFGKMRFWWVNQNRTYREETSGGYLWSPKRNGSRIKDRKGSRNQFYENMREVSPGDRIFSFRKSQIVAIGAAVSNCYDAPQPSEFGAKGDNWSRSGWKVDVIYQPIKHPIRPKDHIGRILPVLPPKYSPLQQDGNGLQSVYLAELSNEFAKVLQDLLISAGNELSMEAPSSSRLSHNSSVDEFEDGLETQIENSTEIEETEKRELVKSRRGQGRYRQDVLQNEPGCRITKVNDQRFLIASHIKPWRHATNEERLDGENGLMLTPTIDHLFDHGFISFADDGQLLISPVADPQILSQLGIPVSTPLNCGEFTEKQKKYLSYHRSCIFLEVGRNS